MKLKKTPLTPDERRLRRAERRAKQRAANVGRAMKMHATRLAYSDASDTGALLRAPALPCLNIGCSGWFYWDWKDRFYPTGMKTNEWFNHYARHFDTVELNASFYSWPTVATVRSWVRQAGNRQFVYTVKASELITHVKQFARTAELVKDFCFIGQLLKPHMGCFLFQLPPSFHYSAVRLKRILDQLDPTLRNVVEFRHASWWNKQTKTAFRKTNTIFCSCSAPRLPNELVQTADEIYIRFHGTERWYRHDYSSDQLTAWSKQIREARPARIWAYFNNDFDGFAIKNAQEFARQLEDLK